MMENENKTMLNGEIMDIDSLPKELFKKSNVDSSSLHDQAFETKPISYLRGAFKRFSKNKGSIVAAIILLIIILYAIIVPFVSPKSYVDSVKYPNGFQDANFAYVLPYNKVFNGSGWWDGTKVDTKNETQYDILSLNDSNHDYITETISKEKGDIFSGGGTLYTVRINTYAVGSKVVTTDKKGYEALVKYETDKGTYKSDEGIMKPIVDYSSYLESYRATLTSYLDDSSKAANLTKSLISSIITNMNSYYNRNARIFYELSAYDEDSGQYVSEDSYFEPVYNADGTPKSIYMTDEDGNYVYCVENNGSYKIRVDYFDYFTYENGFEPYMLFGANSEGKDIFLRLALGTRFSLLLGLGISIINILIGVIWGSISGYYGGKADLIMERFTDIISAIPSIIVLTVCSIQFTNNMALKNAMGTTGIYILAFLVAFVFSGWIGVAGTTRMQFYRFKGQEYVLASRTLGASDGRLIFKHILPNGIGTLVTSSVLMIPSVIFSESSLSYLGIIDFNSSGLSSIGTLLNEGQLAGLSTYPHVLLFPCIIISLLMVCFNLFGNGLRDAFNTSLRGSEN